MLFYKRPRKLVLEDCGISVSSGSSDLSTHHADCHFSEEELEWIRRQFDNSTRILTHYNLRFCDRGDVRIGKEIARLWVEREQQEREDEAKGRIQQVTDEEDDESRDWLKKPSELDLL